MAIVGCGGMAQTYRDRLVPLADRIEVVATVDPLPDRAADLAAAFPPARPETRIEAVLDDIDAAVVMTPHHTHLDVGRQLLQAGKHVMMEKPLALTEDECLELIAEGDRADRVLMAAYPMRFHPLLVSLQEAVADGLIGEVFDASIWTEQYTRYEEGHWAHRRATLGGGQLFSHGCHYIDVLLRLLGEPVRGSHFGTRLGTPWMEGEGTSHATIQFASGALGHHFGTWGARGTQLGYLAQVHGTEGLLSVDIMAGRLRHTTSARTRTIAEAERHAKYLHLGVQHFVDVIEGRADLVADPWSALQSLRVIWRLYEAEQRGVVADLRGLVPG